jgi:hypothetical protein
VTWETAQLELIIPIPTILSTGIVDATAENVKGRAENFKIVRW